MKRPPDQDVLPWPCLKKASTAPVRVKREPSEEAVEPAVPPTPKRYDTALDEVLTGKAPLPTKTAAKSL